MSPQRGKRQQSGLLKGHYRAGQKYRPPMLSYSETLVGDWVRDDLPDLLWPAALTALHGDDGMARYCRFVTEAHDALEQAGVDLARVVLDGRLTSLEAVPPDLRTQLTPMLTQLMNRHNVVPDPLTRLLGLYPESPGSWLLVEPYRTRADNGDEDIESVRFLADLIFRVVTDGEKHAAVKFAAMAWRAASRTLSLSADMVEVLKDYPADPAKRPLAESMIRSSFGAEKGASYALTSRPLRHLRTTGSCPQRTTLPARTSARPAAKHNSTAHRKAAYEEDRRKP